MDTTWAVFDGCRKEIPVFNGQPIRFPHPTFDGFPTYCGAGSGIGDLVVPDVIYEIPISVDCFIHDICWRYCEYTVADFNQSNLIFYENILRTFKHFVPIEVDDKYRVNRYGRATTYYTAVQTGFGPAIFKHMKKEQGQCYMS